MHGLRKLNVSIVGGVGMMLLSACRPYKLEPPPGFVEVTRSHEVLRLKGRDDVGISLRVFSNPSGGSLAYWSEDLVRKLVRRDYVAMNLVAITTKNGVAGTRFDFRYTPPTSSEKKFYTVALFVSDEHRVVLQMAGDWSQRETFAARFDDVAQSLTVRGCDAFSKVCREPQPPRFVT